MDGWKEVCEQRQTVVDSGTRNGVRWPKRAHDDAEWNAESDELGDFIYQIPSCIGETTGDDSQPSVPPQASMHFKSSSPFNWFLRCQGLPPPIGPLNPHWLQGCLSIHWFLCGPSATTLRAERLNVSVGLIVYTRKILGCTHFTFSHDRHK